MPSKLEPIGAPKSIILKIAGKYATENDLWPGAPLEHLVRGLGGDIEYLEFDNATEFDEESIKIRDIGDFTIYLPPHTSNARDRFTIAHELGHYLLQYEEGMGECVARRSAKSSDDRTEWEANWFAAGLLMPEQIFVSAMEAYKDDLIAVADLFAVSPRAVEVRKAEIESQNS